MGINQDPRQELSLFRHYRLYYVYIGLYWQQHYVTKTPKHSFFF